MTIQRFHDIIKLLKNDTQSGYHSPEEIDNALNSASDDKFNEEKKAFEGNSNISDNLHPFKTSASVVMSAGLGDLPANYAYRTNASASSDTIPVTIVPESEWLTVINDPIDTPTTSKPVITIRNQVQVFPAAVTPIKLYYLKKPATMVFGYTVSDEDYVYDSGTSTQCDWPSDCHMDIIRRAAVYLGIPLDDESLVRLEAYKKQTENA
jgi:hypothetical protein